MSDDLRQHVPVLVGELLEQLDLEQSDTVIDATFGFGGHARAVLEQLGPDGRLVGMERDPEVFERAREDFESDPRVTLIQSSYVELQDRLEAEGISSVDAVYFDLGICSYHLERSGRGFSYQNRDDPFDLRFDPDSPGPTAAEWLNNASPSELRSILRDYGELRRLNAVCRALLEARPVDTVGDVVEALERVVPPPGRRAEWARVFQAFRLVVNQELDHLREGLTRAFSHLRSGGRIAVIGFHSLEDRIVKQSFREWANDCVCPPDFPVCACDAVRRCRVLSRSPIQPTREEVEANSRARSAKLRAAEKC